MARGLKSRGVLELDLVRQRAKRQHLLKRISRPDCERIVEMVDELEAFIIKIDERGEE